MFEDKILEGIDKAVQSLAEEVDVLPWKELVRHFAFGRLYVVRQPWSLLEAARIIKNDEAARLRQAMESGDFGTPTPEEAESWHRLEQEFEVLILKPFVLVSPRN